ncbi:hypothetical protein ACFLUY_03380 [Chloroflexota bacterium]
MDNSMFFSLFLGGLIGAAPALVFWIAIIVVTIIMLRRGGGRAERFLVAGVSLNIVRSLLRIPVTAVSLWLFHEGYDTTYISLVTSGCGIFLNVISMAGIICLVYAFWIKFSSRTLEDTGSLELTR